MRKGETLRNITIEFSDGSSKRVFADIITLENGDYRFFVPGVGSIDIRKEYISRITCEMDTIDSGGIYGEY